MKANEISKLIVDCAYHVHTTLGPGLLESVYEAVLADAMRERNLQVERQKPISIHFDGKTFDEGFRADLVVQNEVIVEIKSTERLVRVHKKQLLTYLKLSGLRVGLLVNFGGELLRGNIKRLVVGEAPDLLPERILLENPVSR
jgi:GxxExxY protein